MKETKIKYNTIISCLHLEFTSLASGHEHFSRYSLLAQSHNTPLLPPPKILHNHCLQVLLGHEDVLREIKNKAYANFFFFFWGGGG